MMMIYSEYAFLLMHILLDFTFAHIWPLLANVAYSHFMIPFFRK